MNEIQVHFFYLNKQIQIYIYNCFHIPYTLIFAKNTAFGKGLFPNPALFCSTSVVFASCLFVWLWLLQHGAVALMVCACFSLQPFGYKPTHTFTLTANTNTTIQIHSSRWHTHTDRCKHVAATATRTFQTTLPVA